MSLATFLALVSSYRYAILVPAALFLDIPAGLASGVAVRLGYLSFPLAYPCLMLGALLGDMLWYGIGYHYGEPFVMRFGKYAGINKANLRKAESFFRFYGRRILFFSKLTTGFGFAIPILMTAGMSRLPFWRFITTNIAGQFFWTGGLIAIGYFFGALYLQVNTAFARVSLLPLVVIVGACIYSGMRYAWSRVSVVVERA